MSERLPSITVVIPTHGRVEHVTGLLASLAEARRAYADAGGQADVILVDSSPADAHGRIVAAAGPGAVVLRERNNVRVKRNVGLRAADGEVVLFVDSDCVADRGLLLAHGRAHARGRTADGRRVAGVLGRIVFDGRVGGACRAAMAAGFCDSFSFATRYSTVDWAPCANVSYRRDVLLRLGGFAEHWPGRLGGDDVELGLRVTATGQAIACAPDAVVRHSAQTWASWPAVLERAWRWGVMDVHVRAAQPAWRLRRAGPRDWSILPLGRATPPGQASGPATPSGQATPPPRPGWLDVLRGGALRAVFDAGSLVEAARIGRPGLAATRLALGAMPADREFG